MPFFHLRPLSLFYIFFFFNDTATTEIYTLSLHDALPIFSENLPTHVHDLAEGCVCSDRLDYRIHRDRKSTRLNSSHQIISYAVFCLKKKKNHRDEVGTVQNVVTAGS